MSTSVLTTPVRKRAPVPCVAQHSGSRDSTRLVYCSAELLEKNVVRDSQPAVDELLDLLADPNTDEQVRAAINEWLNG